MKKIQIRGLRFDNVTMEEAVALAAFALKEQRSVSVFTPNAEIARLAEKDASVRDLLNRADLLLQVFKLLEQLFFIVDKFQYF